MQTKVMDFPASFSTALRGNQPSRKASIGSTEDAR
jgi:hypothetical protein